MQINIVFFYITKEILFMLIDIIRIRRLSVDAMKSERYP